MFVFTVEDPGPWQSFAYRPDNIGLPIQIVTDKYLTEQLMFADQYNQFLAYQNWLNVSAAGTQSVASSDTTGPVATAFLPTDNATNVALSPILTITFNENIQKGTGNITIKLISDDSTIDIIDVTSGQVTVTNNQATITLGTSLYVSTDYYVVSDNGVFKDLSNNNWIGISDNSTWNFTTIPLAVTNQYPPDNATDLFPFIIFDLGFNANIQPGSGGIIFLYKSDGTPVETQSCPGGNVTFNPSSITFTFSNPLDNNTGYYIQMTSDCIQDLNGNSWPGINDDTTWNFTTMP